MPAEPEIWRTPDGCRWFLIDEVNAPWPGEFVITNLAGTQAAVDECWAAHYEVSEGDARGLARHHLDNSLQALKRNADSMLAELRQRIDAARHAPASADTPVTPDAVPAVWALIESLPGVIGGSLSGDAARVERASGTMAALQRRLIAAGIDVDARFADFPDRLAGLRADFAKHEAAPPPDADPPPDQ